MKRINKILAMLGLCLALFLMPVSGQKESTAAGFPTIDVSNLLQNMLGYLQDSEIAGLFDQMSDHAINLEEWSKKMADIEQYLSYMQMITQGALYSIEIYDAMNMITRDLADLGEAVVYFQSNAECPIFVTLGAQRVFSEFKEASEEIIKDSKQAYTFVKEVQGGSVLEKMNVMADYARNLQQNIYALSVDARFDMYQLACAESRYYDALSNARTCQMSFI